MDEWDPAGHNLQPNFAAEKHTSHSASGAQTHQHHSFDSQDKLAGEDFNYVIWSNRSAEADFVQRENRMSIIACGIVICVWSILVNLLLLFLLCVKQKRYMVDCFRPFKWLIFNFTIAQLMISAFVAPMNLHIEGHGAWAFGATVCRLWLCIQVLAESLSSWSLVMLSIDRFVYFCCPTLYHKRMTRVKTGLLIILSWTIAFFTLATPAHYLRDSEFVLEEKCAVSMSLTYTVAITSSVFFVPASLTLIAIILSLCILNLRSPWRHQQHNREIILRGDATSAGQNNMHVIQYVTAMESEKDVKNTTITMIMSNLAIFGMWAPFYIANLIISLCLSESRMCINPSLWHIFIWIGYASCGLAPLLWLLDKGLRRDCLCALKCGRERENPEIERQQAFYWENEHNLPFLHH